MPPSDYVKARSSSCSSSINNANGGVSTTDTSTACFVDGYPYLWQYQVDSKDEHSIKDVCVQIFGQIAAAEAGQETNKASMMNDDYDTSLLQVQRISGGVTNVLFKVSGLHSIFNNNNNNNAALLSLPLQLPDDVLVRLFGAEGMINRDEETYYFTILAQHQIAPPYYGRFQNGRLEGWMHNMRPLEASDLQYSNNHNNNHDDDDKNAPSEATMIQAGIAQALAQLHATHVPTLSAASLDDDTITTTTKQHEPTLWIQLEAWYQQALANTSSYQTPVDEQRACDLNLAQYRAELDWLRHDIEQSSGVQLRVAFCHNDLLPANILYKNSNHHHDKEQHQQHSNSMIQLIDFEYGGWNYISFDIANHWNEHAGGPPDSPHPNYDEMLPNATQRRQFCRVYLMETNKLLQLRVQYDDASAAADAAAASSVTEEQVTELVTQVEKFLMPNHLYWGFWAVNQAATEGCDGYDYMEFAKSRLAQYWVCKQQEIVAAADEAVGTISTP